MGFLAVLIKTISLCFVIHSCVFVFTNIKKRLPCTRQRRRFLKCYNVNVSVLSCLLLHHLLGVKLIDLDEIDAATKL